MIGSSNCAASVVQLISIRPIARVVQDFAQHAGRHHSGHPRQVDGRFRVPGPTQHAAFFGHERKQMSRPREVGRLARRVANRLDRASPLGGRDAGPRRAMIDRHRVVRAQRGRVGFDHRMQPKPLADLGQNRHAELARGRA